MVLKAWNGGQRKAVKLQNKIDRINKSEDKYANKLLGRRSKVRSRLERKYDKKIEKAVKNGDPRLIDIRKKNKQVRLEDFDLGTSYVSKALKIGRQNRTKILELKKKSIDDPSIKESDSYKKAKIWAASQMASNIMYGRAYTTLAETSYVANGKSWTRGLL